jgi:hypothetical protein
MNTSLNPSQSSGDEKHHCVIIPLTSGYNTIQYNTMYTKLPSNTTVY